MSAFWYMVVWMTCVAGAVWTAQQMIAWTWR